MIKYSSDFALCIMNAKFLNGHKDMQVQEGKYINRYEVLFTLAREYTGCDTQETLLSIKKRMHQITDCFRIVEMKKDDLFGYKHLQPARVTRRCFHFVQAIAFDSCQHSKGF